MSWSVTLNDLDQMNVLPSEIADKCAEDNPAYRSDVITAFLAAKAAELVSASLSGGRTPSPYGGPDTVVISIVGFSDHREGHAVPRANNFNAQVLSNIMNGPDDA